MTSVDNFISHVGNWDDANPTARARLAEVPIPSLLALHVRLLQPVWWEAFK